MAERSSRARQAANLARTTAAEPATPRVRPARPNETARRFAVDVARIMADDRCEDIVILDLQGISPICDYFVIATGTSDRQMRATTDHIEAHGKSIGEKPYGVGGYEEGAWIVVDYVDVVIHVFSGDLRSYYDLESLWGDAPRVEWTP